MTSSSSDTHCPGLPHHLGQPGRLMCASWGTHQAGPPTKGGPAWRSEVSVLLELDGGAGGLEDLLGLLSVFLASALEDSLGGSVDECLCLTEAEARQ